MGGDTGPVLLIDGYSVAFRAFYGIPPDNFHTSTGQATNAVFGFVSMLITLLRDEQPSHIGVAWDKSRVSFRTAEYGDYKATRGETPEEFRGQGELIQEVLKALAIPSAELEGYEADDILATWATQASQQGLDVLVCSGDRDTFQLVTDRVTVLYPRRGTSDLARMTPAAVAEKYGVPPARYPELAALVGEASDNLPGVPGVGPKTAAKWIGQFDGLDGLLARVDEVTGKAGESLREHVADVVRNRKLNALVTTLDLPLTIDDLARRPWDAAAVANIFDLLEFRALRRRLDEIGPPAEAEVALAGFAVEAAILGADDVKKWLTKHATSGTVGLDFTGTWAADGGDVSAIALAAPDGAAAWLDVTTLTPGDDQALAAWLADPGVTKAGHGVKGPWRALWARGWDLAGLVSDTELAAYLARPDQRRYDLDGLAQRYLQREIAATRAGAGGDDNQEAFDFGTAAADTAAAAEAAALRAATVRDLSAALDEDLADRGGAPALLRDLELPLERILARMEVTGIAADADLFDRIWGDLDGQARTAERSAYDAIGYEVNLASPKQLQTVLFEQLKLPKTKKIKTGYTTDADSLAQLYTKTEHPFLAALLAHRDAVKLRQAVEGLQKAVADDGRIHTTYQQTVAATGRLSSIEPNLQNIPVRTPAGRRIRQGFVAGPGYEALLTADYSQIEMRIMAHVSGDRALIEAFRSGEDFHAVTAARVFGVPVANVTPDQRSHVKAMNYGLAYGLSAFGLSGQLNIPVPEAKALMDGYFAIFGPVRDYLNQIVSEARQTGYTETLLGRRRYLPDLNSDNRMRREMAERMALNAPIQGSAADIIKLAMIRVADALVTAGLSSRMLLQVHDELVFEVAPGERPALEELVREAMGRAVELAVPLDVSVGAGVNWQAAAH
jgi:DNA polymerase-1